MKTYATTKALLIASVSATMVLSSCHFESDKDYKVYSSDSTEAGAHGGSGHGEAHEAMPGSAHGTEHDGSAGHVMAATNDSAMLVDSSHIGKSDGSVTKGTRKGRATMSEWTNDNTSKKEMDAEGIYSSADVMPEYPGGKQAIQKFIEDNVKYPQPAIDEDIEGTVRVTFAVDENGNVYKAVATGAKVGHGLEEEALRVVKMMGKWKPGKVNGKNVKTRLSLPVVFLLS